MLESLLTGPSGGRNHELFTSRNRDPERLGKLLEIPLMTTEEDARLLSRKYDDCNVEQHMEMSNSDQTDTSAALQALKEENEKLREHLDECKSQHTEMSNFDRTDTFAALQASEEENKRLRECLDECKSQLFELLHEDKVSDATIKDDYLRICESIESWIDNVSYSEEGDFNTRFSEILQEEPNERGGKLAGLDLYQPLQDRDKTRSSYWWLERLGSQNSCNIVVLSVVIWHYLYTKIFRECFPIGTRTHDPRRQTITNHATLLKSIINVMEDKYQNQGVY
jgi:hypothetical protein